MFSPERHHMMSDILLIEHVICTQNEMNEASHGALYEAPVQQVFEHVICTQNEVTEASHGVLSGRLGPQVK